MEENGENVTRVFVSKLPVDFSLQKLKFALPGCVSIGKQEQYEDGESSKYLVIEAFLKTDEAANKLIESKNLKVRHNSDVIVPNINKDLPEIVLKYRRKTQFKVQNNHELQNAEFEEHPPILYIAEIPETYSEHKLKLVVSHAVKPRDDVVLNDLEKYVVSGKNGKDETFQFVEIVTNSFESANTLIENSVIKQRHEGKIFALKILEEIPEQVTRYREMIKISETATSETEANRPNEIGEKLEEEEKIKNLTTFDYVKTDLKTKLLNTEPNKPETKVRKVKTALDGSGDNTKSDVKKVIVKQTSDEIRIRQMQKVKPLPRPRNLNKKDIICNGLPNCLLTERELRSHFKKFGRIISLKIDENRKCAWISFVDNASAQAAIANGYFVDDGYSDYVKLHLRFDTNSEYKETTERKTPEKIQPVQPKEVSPISIHEKVHSLQKGLYCRNIPQELFNKRDLARHFERFGNVESVDCVHRRNAPFAKIYFREHESAVQASAGGSHMSNGRKIVVQWDNREVENLRKDLSRIEARITTPYSLNKGVRDFDQKIKPVSHLEPITWFNLLKQNEKLFADFADNCIIVPKTLEIQSLDDLKKYFQCTLDSCGGLVVDIRLMLDGYLIIFDDEKVVEEIVQKDDHELNGTTFMVFKKTIPKVFRDRFVAEVEAEVSTLLMFFELCDQKRQSAPSKIQEMGNSKFSLVQYDRDDYDLKNIMRIAKRDELEGKKLKVYNLCHTDCIKVENIPEGVTQDAIKLTFRSKKKSGGGEVTSVVYEKDENKALIHFADFKVAEQVVNNTKDLKFKGKNVSVSLYYPDFNDDFPITGNNTKQKRSILPFQYNPTCEQDIVHFVFGITKLKEGLVNCLKEIAEIAVVNKSMGNEGKSAQYVIKITPFQSKKLLRQKYTQDRFELECKELIGNYFDQFSVDVVQFNQERMNEMRRTNLWKKDDDFIKVTVAQNTNHDAFVRWNYQKPGSVTITGVKLEVHAIKTFFKLHCDIQDDKRTYPEKKFRKLVECGIFEEVSSKFVDEVELKIMIENCQATVIGAKNKVATFDKEIERQIQDLSSFKLSFMEVEQIEYLTNVLKGKKSVNSFETIFQANLKKSNILASLQLESGIPTIFASDYQVACKAETVVSTMVLKETINIGTNFHQLTQMPEWKKLQQQICSTGYTRVLLDKHKSSVLIVGQESHARKDLETIRSHFEKHNILEKEIAMHYTLALYIREYCFLESDGCLNEIEWEISQIIQGIKLKGMAIKVDKAEKWLKKQISDLGFSTYAIKEPGMPKYFLGDKGKSFLDLQRKINSCIILVGSEKHQDWQPSNLQKRRVNTNERLPSKMSIWKNKVKLSVNVSGITLRVVQGDISLHDCEAIVNASNTDLELRSAGVSGSILKNGGPNIQKAMNQWTSKNGKLNEGMAVSTTAGNLPCNVIIHAVGPRWGNSKTSKCANLLEGSVIESLEEAERHNCRSIAIPAISCGVFGGNATTCVKIIVSSVCEYLIGENSCISQVDFVEYSTTNGHLKLFEKEVRNHQPSTSNPLSSNQSNDEENPGIVKKIKNILFPPSSNYAENSEHFAPPSNSKVNIITGDITNETSDVIVTSTSPKNFSNGHGSATSKALAIKAGKQLVLECQKMAQQSNFSAGAVIKTHGYNLKCQRIYHVLLDNYNGSGSLSVLSHAVQNCIKMAEKSKYSSISFPCLGSGGFHYPINEVIKTTKQIVENYPTTYLKVANIVIFPANVPSVQFHNLNPTPSAAVNISASSGTIGLVNVSVQQGDITTVNADVIINVAPSNFDIAQGGGVSSAIATRAGSSVVTECLNNPQSQTMYYRVTSGGNMSCRHIIHMASSNDVNSMAGVLEEVLAVADSLNARTIAMPTVGTGQLGLNTSLVAQTIGNTIGKFANSNPINVGSISIVVFQPQMLQDFKNGVIGKIIKHQNEGKPSVKHFSNKNTGLGKNYKFTRLTKVGQNSNVANTQIHLCCKDNNALSDTWSEITKHITEMSTKKTFQDKVLNHLDLEEEMEISALQEEFDVTIETDKKGGESELVISGLMQNVSDVYNKIQLIIHNLKEAINRANYVTWKYKDSHGKLNTFSPKINLALEDSYKKNPQSTAIIPVFVGNQWKECSFNFNKMTETCRQTGIMNDICRTTPEDAKNDLPTSWENMGNSMFKQVGVQISSNEYNAVIQKFQNAGLPLTNVIRLERLQNPTLYHQYLAQTKKVQSRGGNRPVSRELYHGTCEASCSNVSRDGFDRGFAGKHATAFGKGVYFATTAKYSHGFAQANASGHRFMFMADVVTGEFCQGNSQYAVAPTNQATNLAFDSVVNDVNNPAMFVVFKDASVYPKYLLTYV